MGVGRGLSLPLQGPWAHVTGLGSIHRTFLVRVALGGVTPGPWSVQESRLEPPAGKAGVAERPLARGVESEWRGEVGAGPGHGQQGQVLTEKA